MKSVANITLALLAGIGIGIGIFFLFGGITMISMLGGPLWFNAADLLLAYIPMGYLGAVLAGATRSDRSKLWTRQAHLQRIYE